MRTRSVNLIVLCALALQYSFFPVLATKTQAIDELLGSAEKKYRQGQFDEAIVDYRKVLEKSYKNIPAHIGLARAYLKKDELGEAQRIAQKAYELDHSSAVVRALLGDILFRKADFEGAQSAYLVARNLDPSLARAHWGLGRVLLTDCHYKSAKARLAEAYRLDPTDPDILLAWAGRLKTAEQKLPVLESYLASHAGQDPEEVGHVRNRVELLKGLGNRETFILQGGAKSTRIDLVPLRDSRAPVRGVGVKVSFNRNKTQTLLLDTGSSGILISQKAAVRLGIKRLASSQFRGIGDEGLRAAYVGWADVISIGDLVFNDCLVTVAEGKSINEQDDGIIGTDIFRRFLIKLDLPRSILELEPLAKLAGQPDAGDDWDELDRTIPPGMERFTLIRRVGNQLLIRAKVNDAKYSYFVIDTGAAFNAIDAALAKEVSDVAAMEGLAVKGSSGKVKKIDRADRILLSFAVYRQPVVNMLTLDLKTVSRTLQAEVSGLLGFPTLQKFLLELDYRDGLVDFVYKP